MPTNYITLTRQELYDMVWATPMSSLAKDFGISDVALAKRCRASMYRFLTAAIGRARPRDRNRPGLPSPNTALVRLPRKPYPILQSRKPQPRSNAVAASSRWQ